MLTTDALVRGFHEYGKPRPRWRVGAEFERIGVRPDGSAVPYGGPGGIRQVLDRLADRYGWRPCLEGGNLVGLRRGAAATTLEPGGQVELSGSPFASPGELAREALASLEELRSVTRDTGVTWVALGLSPYARTEAIPWVPKGRYEVMRRYLPPRGELAPVMMKASSAFQASFDYSDEADCAAKFDTMLRLAPLTVAIFANSPIREGRPDGYASFRAHAWAHTDPDRTGFPEPVREGYSHERWVDFLLDVPMMFHRRDGRYLPAGGLSFRRFMEQGIDGRRPGWDDWELHQTSVFPEVRVKGCIEVRGADACPLPLAIAGIALWTGLLYDPGALEEAGALAEALAATAPAGRLFRDASLRGLDARAGGRRLAGWARDLVEIGSRGLSRILPEDAALLEPLRRLVEAGESPAARVLRLWSEGSDPSTFLPKVAW